MKTMNVIPDGVPSMADISRLTIVSIHLDVCSITQLEEPSFCSLSPCESISCVVGTSAMDAKHARNYLAQTLFALCFLMLCGPSAEILIDS